MKNVQNVTIQVRNCTYRLSAANYKLLMQFVEASPLTVITGVRNGRPVRFQYVSGSGYGWVET